MVKSKNRAAALKKGAQEEGQVEQGSAGQLVTLRPLPGLKNMGNTCWLNAVMQALTHCQPLVEAIEQSEHSGTSDSTICVLRSVEEHVLTACRTTAPFMSPEKIVNLLPMISSSLMRGRQEDAHEFLRTLVSSMQLALEMKNNKGDTTNEEDDDTSQVSGFSHNRKRRGHAKKTEATGRRSSRLKKEEKEEEEEDNLTDSDNDNDESVGASPVESQYPFSLFKGAIQNQVRCTRCKKLSTKEDPVEDLELEISRSSSLESALTQFCAEEELKDDNAYHCEKCRAKVTAKKRIKLHRMPPVLTVSLKRFAVTMPQYATSSSSASTSTTAAVARTAQSPPPGAASKGGLWGLFSASKNGHGQAASQSRYDRNASVGGTRRCRGRGGPQKIQHYVHYPEYLDLSPFCTGTVGDKESKKHGHERFMRLFAVVVHLGSTIGAGHYVAYVRSLSQGIAASSPRKSSTTSSGSGNGRATAGWHRMDDCNVTLCSTEEALNQCAYILFYERCSEAEVRQWQRAQDKGLSDINRIYSEKLLASQDKEEKKRERRTGAPTAGDEGAAAGVGMGGKMDSRARAGSTDEPDVVRALPMDEEEEADGGAVGEAEVDSGDEGALPEESDAAMEGEDEEEDEEEAGGGSQGGLLSWLFASSPSSSPSVAAAPARTATTSANTTRQTRRAPSVPVASKNASEGTGGARRTAARADKGKAKAAPSPVRRSGRAKVMSEGTAMDDDGEDEDEQDEDEDEDEEEEGRGRMTRSRKRQKVGPGEGIVAAVAEFVGGLLYEK